MSELPTSSDLPPGTVCADQRWQDGYNEGIEDMRPTSTDAVYVSGWLTGYMGNQCSEKDALARYREHVE